MLLCLSLLVRLTHINLSRFILFLFVVFLVGCDGGVTQNTPPVPTQFRMKAAGPPCKFDYSLPWHVIELSCVEMVYDNITIPEFIPELAGLAMSLDGTLYFSRTALGEIWSMRDHNGDGFMDEAKLFADGLVRPTGIVEHEGGIFVATADSLLELRDTDGDNLADEIQTIVDYPNGEKSGIWSSSVGVGPDERLYLSIGANCDSCEQLDSHRGVLLSFELDGSDERVEATGFRNPADFAWHPVTHELWLVDSGPVVDLRQIDGPPGELNLIKPGANYGFPDCYGRSLQSNTSGLPEADFCAQTEGPLITFPYQSNPSGIVFYTSNLGREDKFWFWENSLVVAFSGSWNLVEPAGYELSVVKFVNGRPRRIDRIAPKVNPPEPVDSLSGYSISGRGFFPYRPVDVVVSPEGWIYVALEEGRIIRFRPIPAAQ